MKFQKSIKLKPPSVEGYSISIILRLIPNEIPKKYTVKLKPPTVEGYSASMKKSVLSAFNGWCAMI
jgi:hypothetical protein